MKLAYRLNKDKVQTFQFNIQDLTPASDTALLFNPATSGFSLFLNHLGIFQAALSLQILASGRDILPPLLCLVEFSPVHIGAWCWGQIHCAGMGQTLSGPCAGSHTGRGRQKHLWQQPSWKGGLGMQDPAVEETEHGLRDPEGTERDISAKELTGKQ